MVDCDGNDGGDGISDRVDDCQHVDGWMDAALTRKRKVNGRKMSYQGFGADNLRLPS